MSKPKLTSTQYVQESGSYCPNCASQEIESFGGYDGDGTYITSKTECTECEATWTEVYVLSEYTDLEVTVNEQT